MNLLNNDKYDSYIFRNHIGDFNLLNGALHLSSLIVEHSFRNGVELQKRIKNLNLAPEITLDSTCRRIILDNKVEFYADSKYHTVPEILLSLGYLTGNGFFKSDFVYEQLKSVDSKDWKVARSFASEIMDANVHKYYIQKKFPNHDDTKTPVFCYLLAKGDRKSVV